MLGNNNFPWLFNSLACPENTRQDEGAELWHSEPEASPYLLDVALASHLPSATVL